MDFKNSKRFKQSIDLIDKENQKDPNIDTDAANKEYTKEFLYSLRMTEVLDDFYPEAGELVHLAARGQHIKRWTILRTKFPEGRIGYHKWRRNLTELHCSLIRQIMSDNDYLQEEINYVEKLIGKKEIKADPESQKFQDVVSLVFLKYYATDFISKHSSKNIDGILKKVLLKMSEEAINKALTICPTQISEAINAIR